MSVIFSFSLAGYAADVQTYGVGKGQVYLQFVTNAPANSFIVVDPGATNSRRYYRAFN